MQKCLEFKVVGTNIYCREVAIGNLTGSKIILSGWFFYASTNCC